MRVALYGNLCNNLYEIAKAVRSASSIDVHLYIDEGADVQELPESDDPELAGRYPDWIHTGHYARMRDRLMPWSSALIAELRQYDLVVTSGLGPTFAQFAGRPTAFLTAGGDLTVKPFADRQLAFVHKPLWKRLPGVYEAFWQRRGIRKCAELWTQPFAPFRDAAARLGVADRIAPAYFPLMIDTAAFREVEPAAEISGRFDFSVFHPSRMMLSDTPALRATGQWKQNDLLFRAFARFLEQAGAERAGLVLIDREVSFEVERARRVIAELGLEPHVLWLKPPRAGGFTRDELVPMYSAASVVADDFGVGWFGSVVLEGLAVSRPVLCYVDEAAMRTLYPWHPILSDHTVDGNAALLTKLYRDAAFRTEQGRKGRAWIEEFHAVANAARAYAERFVAAAERMART